MILIVDRPPAPICNRGVASQYQYGGQSLGIVGYGVGCMNSMQPGKLFSLARETTTTKWNSNAPSPHLRHNKQLRLHPHKFIFILNENHLCPDEHFSTVSYCLTHTAELYHTGAQVKVRVREL